MDFAFERSRPYALEFFYESNQTVSVSAVDGCTKDNSHNGADKFDCNNSEKPIPLRKTQVQRVWTLRFPTHHSTTLGTIRRTIRTFQVKIPREYFEHNNLEKVDIAPQKNGSNSAFMIYFKDASGMCRK